MYKENKRQFVVREVMACGSDQFFKCGLIFFTLQEEEKALIICSSLKSIELNFLKNRP